MWQPARGCLAEPLGPSRTHLDQEREHSLGGRNLAGGFANSQVAMRTALGVQPWPYFDCEGCEAPRG